MASRSRSEFAREASTLSSDAYAGRPARYAAFFSQYATFELDIRDALLRAPSAEQRVSVDFTPGFACLVGRRVTISGGVASGNRARALGIPNKGSAPRLSGAWPFTWSTSGSVSPFFTTRFEGLAEGT